MSSHKFSCFYSSFPLPPSHQGWMAVWCLAATRLNPQPGVCSSRSAVSFHYGQQERIILGRSLLNKRAMSLLNPKKPKTKIIGKKVDGLQAQSTRSAILWRNCSGIWRKTLMKETDCWLRVPKRKNIYIKSTASLLPLLFQWQLEQRSPSLSIVFRELQLPALCLQLGTSIPKMPLTRYLITPPVALQTATASGSIGDLPVKIYCKQFNSLWQAGKHLDYCPRKPRCLKYFRFSPASSFLSLQT